MSHVIDMSGRKIGKLTVLSRAESNKNRACWVCECECGNTCVVSGKYLRNGDTRSCGCLNLERVRQMGKSNSNRNSTYIRDDIVHVKFHNSDEEFICDVGDLEYVTNATWHMSDGGYARGEISGKLIMFHNYIMCISPSEFEMCDHINGNRLDNRRCNLRVVTRQQNSMNKSAYKNNITGSTGVHRSQNGEKWVAVIGKDKKIFHLGTFDDRESANEARGTAEIELFGEYRREDAFKRYC